MKSRFFEKGNPLYYFEDISAIPRGSGNRAKICAYLMNFAKEHGLFAISDEYGNVIIKKPATKGYEDRPTVIIQGHSDMVCAVEEGVEIDMKKEPLSLFMDDDLLGARGTSLGADDGVFVSYALSLLADEKAEHPRLEALFTSDEEIGMLGATGLDGSLLDGRLLINIDTDREGEFIVGCAGGVRLDISLPVSRVADGGFCYTLSLSGLLGGHSGAEIHRGRKNAISVTASLLSKIPDIRLVALSGGTADNAIPRDAEATFLTHAEITSEEKSALTELFKSLTQGEDDALLRLERTEHSGAPITKDDSVKLLSLISEIPTGVLAMSPYIEGLVESSENIGIVSLSEEKMSLSVSIRSSKHGEKESIVSNLCNLAGKYGASATAHGAYPEWEYRENSHLRDTMCTLYRDTYGHEPKVYAIHAGLECGLLSSKLPGLDCVSMGPDTYDIHTPSERLSVPSAERVYEYLKLLLKKI